MAKFRIKSVIAARGMTTKTLADKMGVKPQSISAIINEKTNPNISTLEKMAEALEVPVASLFADYLSPNTAIVICPQCGGRSKIKTGEQ